MSTKELLKYEVCRVFGMISLAQEWVKNILGWDPAPFLWSIVLQLDEIS